VFEEGRDKLEINFRGDSVEGNLQTRGWKPDRKPVGQAVEMIREGSCLHNGTSKPCFRLGSGALRPGVI
jgi:hypothetical protein